MPEAHVKRSVLVRTVETRDGEVGELRASARVFPPLTPQEKVPF